MRRYVIEGRGGGGGCFASGTIIDTKGGPKKIEDVGEGDSVLTFNEGGELSWNVVSQINSHDDETIVKYRFWNATISATPNHWVQNQFGTFSEIGTLTTEDAIIDANGHLRPLVSSSEMGKGKVHTLIVEGNHTFIANGLRVHNGGLGRGNKEEFIEGSKGGGGKGGGGGTTVYTPTEAPNTLRSKSIARVIDLIGEGTIKGLVDQVDPLKCVYLDDLQVLNDDDTHNFEGVTHNERKGLPDQDPISGFSEVESEVILNQEFKFATPVIINISDSDNDAIRLKVRLNALYQQTTQGDLIGSSVDLRIELQPDGGSYSVVQEPTISGKTVSTYEEEYRIPLTGNAPWNIRISRLTADAATAAISDKTFVYSYTEIIEAKLTYPHSALQSLEVDSQLFGGRIPRRSYLVDGLLIQIPSNYDPYTRVYTGIWDGTFQDDWTDNPAWILYDILTNNRYGLGDVIDASQVDKWSLYTIAQYCDELVDDGFGGQEPRYTINIQIQRRQEAFALINQIVSAFRGMAYWSFGAVTAVHDAPKEATRIVNTADVVKGIFDYEGSSLSARHTVVLVTWNDPADNYKQAIEVVEDQELIQLWGWKPVHVAAFGCSSRGLAHRLGKWILETENSETEVVQYSTGLDHADCRPGEIIKINDPSRAGARLGGRLRAVSGDALTLDQDYIVEVGDQVLVVVDDDTIETLEILSNLATNQIRVSPAPSTLVSDALYLIQKTTVEPEQWRVVSVKDNGDNTFSIVAMAYNPNKFAAVEQGIVFDPPVTTLLPTGSIRPPTNLTWSEGLYKVNNAVFTRVTISVTPSTDPRVTLYRIEAKPPNQNNWFTIQISPSITAEIKDAEAGTWSFAATALASGDSVVDESSRVELTNQNVLGKTANPGNVTGLGAVRGYTSVELYWNVVTDLDLTGYNIVKGDSWIEENLIAERFVGNRITVALDTTESITFLVRAIDELGNLSDIPASVITQVASPPTITNLYAYQVGSRLKIEWKEPTGVDQIQYEIREGTTWSTSLFLGTTATSEFSTEISVDTITTVTIIVRSFVELSSGVRSYGTEVTRSITKYPVLGENIVVSADYHPTWTGVKANLEITANDELALIEDETEGTYDFVFDLGSEQFGRMFARLTALLLDNNPLEINSATGFIADATYPITSSSLGVPQVDLYLVNEDPDSSPYIDDATMYIADAGGMGITPVAIDKPLREADYQFTSQPLRVIFKRDAGDTSRPALSALSLFFDLPDRML